MTTLNNYVIFCFLALCTTLIYSSLYFYVKLRALRLRSGTTRLNSGTDSTSTSIQTSYQEVLRNLRNQEFLFNFTNYLNSPSKFDHKINNALNILGKYTGVCRIYIFEDYGNGKMSANTFEWCKSGIPARKEENKRLAYNIHLPNWKGLLIKDGIIYFNDLQKTPSDLKALLESRLVKSMIVLPIYIDNDFYGFLGFDHCIQLHTWNSMEIGFLKTISIILSNTFERRITEEERKQMEREILSTIIQTEEKERGRIARDLHDGLGPLLSSLKLYAKILGNADETKKRAEILVTTNEVIDESLLMIKEISNNLSPHVLNDFGLAAAIQSFCKKMTLTKAIDINFDSNVYDLRFEINVELVLFRILKELVNNTIKHALASRIEIFLLKTENLLSLIYSDDGTGFDIKKVLDNHITGMGISNIINRIGSINGKLMFESQAEKGIQVKISVALNK